jgi:hypothetical protein
MSAAAAAPSPMNGSALAPTVAAMTHFANMTHLAKVRIALSWTVAPRMTVSI